ncbi:MULTISPECIES: hypothetical protein [Aminobacterium]|jgi:hypothetical protein|nr:hypothetical protein [Aminobacterium sp. UBA4834]
MARIKNASFEQERSAKDYVGALGWSMARGYIKEQEEKMKGK